VEKKIEVAIAKNVSPDWLYEAILQSYLFLGYPAALEGLRTLSQVVGTRALSGEQWDTVALTWREQGQGTARLVYLEHLQTLLSRLEKVTPELSEWMIVEVTGKFFPARNCRYRFVNS